MGISCILFLKKKMYLLNYIIWHYLPCLPRRHVPSKKDEDNSSYANSANATIIYFLLLMVYFWKPNNLHFISYLSLSLLLSKINQLLSACSNFISFYKGCISFNKIKFLIKFFFKNLNIYA